MLRTHLTPILQAFRWPSWRGWWLSLGARGLSWLRTRHTSKTAPAPRRSRATLVKSRPPHLPAEGIAYSPLAETALVDELFLRLRRTLFQELDKSAARGSAYRESGRLANQQRYFYIQPQGQKGWLFERSGAGWLISQAVKHSERDLLVREREIFDRIELLAPNAKGRLPRIRTTLLGDDLLSMPVYEQKLLQDLGLLTPSPPHEGPSELAQSVYRALL